MKPQEKIAARIDALSLILSCFFIFSFIIVAFASMTYPFGLEWMEGHSIDIIQRIRHGLPVYTAPSLEYVPFIYTPSYFYLSALVSYLSGVDFFAGRFVSTLAALGTGFILYRWIRREGGDWKTALITAGLFFATYKLSGRWFDVARIDSLYTMLMLAGLYVFYFYRGAKYALIAAAIMASAFFTKQSALLALLPPLLGGMWLDKKHALQTLGLFIFMVFIGTAIANVVTNGWFVFYIFEVPAGHGLEERMFHEFWQRDVLRNCACLLALMVMAYVYCQRAEGKKIYWYLSLAAGMVCTVYIARLHWGGWVNVLIPMHAVFALLAGRCLISLKNFADKKLLPVAGILVCLQLLTLIYAPWKMIPSQESVEKGERFLKEIAAIPGDIFTSEIQFVQSKAGKKSYTFGMAAFDILRSDLGNKNHIKEQLRKDLRDALAEHRFSAVIAGRLLKLREKDAYYRFDREVDYPKEYATGAIPTASTGIYVPRKNNIQPDPAADLDFILDLGLEDDK